MHSWFWLFIQPCALSCLCPLMQSWGLFQTRVCWTMSPPSQETRLRNKARVSHPQFSPSGLAYHQYLANSSLVSRRVNSWIWRSSYQTAWASLPLPHSYQTKMRSSLSRPKGAKSQTSQNGCNATALCSCPNIQIPRQDPRPYGLSGTHHRSLHGVWFRSVARL